MAEESGVLLMQVFLAFLGAKAMGEIFARLGLTAVLGEILAGVLLGPSLLGWVRPGGDMHALAELGAVFLLFTVGLETSAQSLVRVGKPALLTAFAGVAAPFAMGFGYLIWLRQPTSEAAFVGAAMVATSVGITARVLRDLGVLGLRSSRIVLGAAVFDDILGLLLLGVVAALATGAGVSWLRLALIALEALAFAVFMIFVAPRIVTRIEPGIRRMHSFDAPLASALALCLGLSAFATKIGMAAIIGAFFAGLAFADYPAGSRLAPKGQAINQLLSPLFFFAMGARLELHSIDASLLGHAAVITALAIVSKIAGAWLANRREPWREWLRIGVGMTPRGEVALIVALMGLQAGVITQRAYAIVVLMTAATTMLPPPFLKLLYRGERPTMGGLSAPDGELG